MRRSNVQKGKKVRCHECNAKMRVVNGKLPHHYAAKGMVCTGSWSTPPPEKSGAEKVLQEGVSE